MPWTSSTPWSPRLVTVIVGSDSSELLSVKPRARATRSVSSRISSSRLFASASRIAGATSPPCRIEIATPRWMPGPGRNAPFSKKPLSCGCFRSASATAFSSSTASSTRCVTGRPSLRAASQRLARASGMSVAR